MRKDCRWVGVMVGVLALALGCGSKTGLGVSDSTPPPPTDSGRPDSFRPDAGPPPFDAGPPPPDAGPPPFDGGRPCRRQSPVDLLLVIDNSGSMFEEQIHLAEQLPRLVGDLVDPPDNDGDGEPDWRPILDLHMGVVTSEVNNADGLTLCGNPGADGIMRRDSDMGEGCRDRYPRFLSYRAGRDDADAISRDFGCVARAGTEGCGVEQHLEAALKAVMPSSVDLGYLGQPGRGDRQNDGFLRDLSLLAIVVLADEDDCSYTDPTIFDDFMPDPTVLPPCLRPGDPLFPIERYADAFRSLRRERPDLFAFATIAGVPERLVPDPTAVDYERVLADSFMQNRIDPIEPLRGVVPACEGPRGRAFPGRRLVRLAQAFGDQAAVGSICQESYSPVVGAIARLVGTRACEEFE